MKPTNCVVIYNYVHAYISLISPKLLLGQVNWYIMWLSLTVNARTTSLPAWTNSSWRDRTSSG